jgi:predicted metal-dependent peptidase
MARKRRSPARLDPATESFGNGLAALYAHPMFAPLAHSTDFFRCPSSSCPDDGWALVTSRGVVHVHPTRRAEPEQWTYVLAHCLLHLGFGHLRARERRREWSAACDVFVARFLRDLRLGRPHREPPSSLDLPAVGEERLYELFRERGLPAGVEALGVGGAGASDMDVEPVVATRWGRQVDWAALLGEGLSEAVGSAVRVAAGREPTLGAAVDRLTPAQAARAWFVSSYPLLGALAATFKVVEDPRLCQRLGISVAAVDFETREIFVNPAAGLDEAGARFVLAHELLHVGLRHDVRRRGRDPYLWNVACDFAVNGWLVEMGVGQLPTVGCLYDPALKGESAESIYDRIAADVRRYRKLATLRGVGLGDMLERRVPDGSADAVELDEFYRRCLAQGLLCHQAQGRGLLPAGLVEEVEALAQPPIPWDVELARWFDQRFAPLERRRSYARPSRRQSSTPDIPRPSWPPTPIDEQARTFGVVLDTSGSMDRAILARALGAIASYSLARDVPAARVVFCDAAAYDQGYVPPEAIAERVQVRGRGGTVLQPGVDLLEMAPDFPRRGPILVITDGYCDRVRVARDHAFLLPEGHDLPFVPHGPVFRIT